jgi:hypothetical protein
MIMQPIEILEKLVTMFQGNGGKAPETALLMADLPDEAISNRIEGVADWKAELSGYKAGYVLKAAIERLGPGGWSDVAIYSEPLDAFLTKAAARDNAPDGVLVNCDLVVYFPGLNKGCVTSGTGDGATLADAKKAARTTALKRALAEVGIGIRGYLGDLSDERGKGPRPEDIPGNGPPPPAPVPQSSRPAAQRPTTPPPAPPAKPTPQPPTKPAPAPAAPPSNSKASDLQINKIRNECEAAGVSVEQLEAQENALLCDITKARASVLIDLLIKGRHPLQAPPAGSDPYGAGQ